MIGDRATLVPAPEHASYGILIDLPKKEVLSLYSQEEVRGYEAERVETIRLHDASHQHAMCYVLPSEKIVPEVNISYAQKLAALASDLGLPSGYAREIADLVTPSDI
jgi:hypothetical protein